MIQTGSIDGSPSVPLPTFEQKLETLARCGIRLEPEFAPSELLTMWPRESFERPGYGLVLDALGSTEERPPWRHHCANLWSMDAEAIANHVDYARIALRIKEMTKDSLPIENIRDFVDIRRKVAWLGFQLNGSEFHLDFRVQDDWVDPKIFGELSSLLESCEPNKLLIYLGSGGQTVRFASVTHDNCEALEMAKVPLEKLTVSSLNWLEPKSP